MFDPDLSVRKRKPGLNLFQAGAVPEEHQNAVQAHHDSAAAKPPEPSGLPGVGSVAAPVLLTVSRARAPVPEMEWWDVAVLAQATYEPATDGTVALKDSKVTDLVEHPVPIEPPMEAPAPAPQALKLTKQVRAAAGSANRALLGGCPGITGPS